MSKSRKRLGEIVMEILAELYANSTPSVDFNELVENASIDKDGRKVIPFDDYEIDDTTMRNIVNYHCKKNRLTKYEKSFVSASVYLGPSPRSIRKKEV